MGKFVAVCRVEEVAEGRGLPVEVEGLRIAIFRDGASSTPSRAVARTPTARWAWAGSRRARRSARSTAGGSGSPPAGARPSEGTSLHALPVRGP